MEIRDKVQQEASTAWFNANGVGTLALGTGVGKSKVAIDIVKIQSAMNENYRVMLVTPTIILHEQNWRNEFEKFGSIDLYNRLTRVCYVSLPKYDPDDYDLIIFDEYHHISERGFDDFSSRINPGKTKILGLTATPPKRGDRKDRFDEICPVVYAYSVGEAAGIIVNDFHINVIKVPLDSTTKNIKAGTAKASFFTTEQANYEYWSKEVELAGNSGDQQRLMWKALSRKRALDNFPSRVAYAKKIISAELTGYKSIIFAPSIKQAEQVCSHAFHSKVQDGQMIVDFIEDRLDHIAAVSMIDEGMTMGKVEKALIMKLSSTDKTFVQRIGRVCRNDLDKISHIYVLVYANTVEEKYLKEALSSIDDSKISYHKISEYDATTKTTNRELEFGRGDVKS